MLGTQVSKSVGEHISWEGVLRRWLALAFPDGSKQFFVLTDASNWRGPAFQMGGDLPGRAVLPHSAGKKYFNFVFLVFDYTFRDPHPGRTPPALRYTIDPLDRRCHSTQGLRLP
jgi:hypothetical protein